MELHSARLISISEPTSEIKKELGVDSAEGLIAYIARVSNPKNQSNEKIENLLKYCLKNKHYSVFESVYLTVEIYTTRDIATQIIRHRSAVFQSFSQRYSNQKEMNMMYEVPEFRGQDLHNKQASIEDFNIDTELQQDVEDALSLVEYLYNKLIESGVAKECARRILPECSTTRLYMTNNVRSWIHYIEARTYEGAQKEHRLIAESIKKIFKQQFPTISTALDF